MKIINEDTKPIRLQMGHFYRFTDPSNNREYVGQYIGRQPGFNCIICGKGNNAHCFNVYYGDDDMSYETWSYGREHFPEIIEDVTDNYRK